MNMAYILVGVDLREGLAEAIALKKVTYSLNKLWNMKAFIFSA